MRAKVAHLQDETTTAVRAACADTGVALLDVPCGLNPSEHDPGRHGEPVNAEPHKCAKIEWFPVAALPSNTYPYTAAGIHAWQTGNPLQLSGWH